MTVEPAKVTLHRYLESARSALLWKLEGVSEYDVRRPLTPSGTNLLGLVKHLAGIELGYFGDTFGRPGAPVPWEDGEDEPNVDMWATADESRDEILDVYRSATDHADATIEALALDATGVVAWWPDDRNPVTLHQILVHMIAETNRHGGHADIVRELVDGSLGHRVGVSNLPDVDDTYWPAYRAQVESAALEAARRAGSGPG